MSSIGYIDLVKLANVIKLKRIEIGNFSQQQLAEMVGCSRQTIISIEAGKMNPSVEIALKLSHALNTSVDALFSIEEGEDKENFCKKVRTLFNCYKK
jgi:putative transcriptional regulator